MQDTTTVADIRREPLSGKLSITAIILTLNEEVHIDRCLSRIQPLVERVIVIDSFSTDRTVEIARQLGAEVLQHAFKHQADQLQWALDNCDVRSDWVLRLDADEYLELPLIGEIRAKLPVLPMDVTGVMLKRKLIFRGKWIRFGGYYPTVLLRLWRTGKAEVQQLWMDEHALLKKCRSIRLEHDFCDHSLLDISSWIDKHNRYSTRKMADYIAIEYGLNRASIMTRDKSGPSKAWKQFLQYSLFRRAPLYLRSVLYFIYRYAFRLGFLDGKRGFLWHAMQGFWYFLLTDIKIEDARAYIAAHGIEAFKVHLQSNHKLPL